MISLLVLVSPDFELGRKLRCDIPVWLAGGVDRQSHTGLVLLLRSPALLSLIFASVSGQINKSHR